MTREKAIDLLDNLIGMIGDSCISDYDTALQMGIEALEQEPCDKCVYSTKDGYCQYDDITEAIPPVTPQPKTGHWFIDERPESDREIICSNCEQPIFKYYKLDFDYRPKFCPNCGAKMVEPQESEE